MKAQLIMIFFFFYFLFFYFFFYFYLSKPRFSSSHHKNLKISRKTLLKSNHHRPYASVHMKYESNKWSLFNPTHESETGISNDMQCSNKLNISMTCNPQLWCTSCPINNIAKQNFLYTKTNKIYTDKNNQGLNWKV